MHLLSVPSRGEIRDKLRQTRVKGGLLYINPLSQQEYRTIGSPVRLHKVGYKQDVPS